MLPPDRVATGSSGRARMSNRSISVGRVLADAPLVDPSAAAEVVEPLHHQVVGDRQVPDQARVSVLRDAADAGAHHPGRIGPGQLDDRRPRPIRPSAAASRKAPRPARSGRCRRLPPLRRSRRHEPRATRRRRQAVPGVRQRAGRGCAASAGPRAPPASADRSTPKLGRPTIMRASSRSSVWPSTVPTSLPRRRTLTRSLMARTSASLWLMKTTASPSATSERRVANRASTSSRDEHRGRLVEDQDPAVARERLEDLDALLLPDRQVLHARRSDPPGSRIGSDASAARRPAAARSSRRPLDRPSTRFSATRHRPHQREVLGDHPDAGGDRVVRRPDGQDVALDHHLAGVAPASARRRSAWRSSCPPRSRRAGRAPRPPARRSRSRRWRRGHRSAW